MNETYRIPARTCIGHVHLKVSDLERSLEFYCGLLGFELVTMYGNQAAFVSAGGYHHHIGLNTWYSRGRPAPDIYSTGLFHAAILYPTRRDLAQIYDRIRRHKYHLTGASDHGVSEALYLDDPDGNGLEMYWDKPREEWTVQPDGKINMYTHTLDLKSLLGELI
jgi:catechol 2,3-dioxygenase